jgi:D-lactate dehydrogenase
MKIYLFEIQEGEAESFAPLEKEHQVICRKEKLTAENAGQFEDADYVSVFVHSDLDADAIEAMPGLKGIATRSTGFDHIDMDACRKQEIPVAFVPTYGENTVASHAIGLLLNIAHRISDGIDRTRKGDFTNQGLQGFDIAGKTIGVIGASGSIGRHFTRMARGLEMKVLAQDVVEDEEFAREWNFDYVDMDELCRNADFISVHVPLNEKTEGMIDASVFDKVKKGCIFINTSRGGVVNERDLLKALASGRVGAAGLDVVSAEPIIREEAELVRMVMEEKERWGQLLVNETLLNMRNVYATPHNAFNTREALQRILDVTRENLEGLIEGSDQVHLVGE